MDALGTRRGDATLNPGLTASPVFLTGPIRSCITIVARCDVGMPRRATVRLAAAGPGHVRTGIVTSHPSGTSRLDHSATGLTSCAVSGRTSRRLRRKEPVMVSAVINVAPEGNLSRYLQEIRKFPMLTPEEELALSQALARPRGHGGRAQAGHLASAPGRQDRHGLPRLRPAGRRADQRRQCRHDAGGQALRSGPRLPPGHLRHVVDPRRDPGIHPAQLVAGEDGHHGGAEEAVLQPAPAEGPDAGDRRRRSAARAGGQDRHACSTCPSRTWSA